MTNIVGQLFKSLDPWPGFQITSFKIQVSPVDGRKTLRKLFKNPCSQAELNKIVPFGFSLQRQKMVFFFAIKIV